MVCRYKLWGYWWWIIKEAESTKQHIHSSQQELSTSIKCTLTYHHIEIRILCFLVPAHFWMAIMPLHDETDLCISYISVQKRKVKIKPYRSHISSATAYIIHEPHWDELKQKFRAVKEKLRIEWLCISTWKLGIHLDLVLMLFVMFWVIDIWAESHSEFSVN